jgi:hypothetical protein
VDSDRFVVAQPQRLPAYYECGSVVAGCCCTGALLAGPSHRASSDSTQVEYYISGYIPYLYHRLSPVYVHINDSVIWRSWRNVIV